MISLLNIKLDFITNNIYIYILFYFTLLPLNCSLLTKYILCSKSEYEI